MTQNEFESLTGKQVTLDEYAIADAVYMNAGDMDKQSFCADWKKHETSAIIKELSNMVTTLKERNEKLKTTANVAMDSEAERIRTFAEYLTDKAEEYQDREMAHKAVELIGMKEFIKYKIEKGYKLYRKDLDFILTEFGGTIKNQIEAED